MTAEDVQAPTRGDRVWLDGELVVVEMATITEASIDLIVRRPDGRLEDRTVTHAQLAAARVLENDGGGAAPAALAGLWGRWMQYTSPRLRSAALATRPLRPYAHQDEAVFDHMLPQPRLRLQITLNNRVRLIVRRAFGFHSARTALALVMLSCGPINLLLPHERTDVRPYR